jgi:hypothetical protein
MERYDQGSRVAVIPPQGQGTVIIIIISIVIIIFIVLAIILIRRATTPVSSSGGTGSTECINDLECPGKNVCDPETGKCVECVGESNCPAERPLCNAGKCVNCIDASNCPVTKPICDDDLKQCVQCVSDGNCGGATPICNLTIKRCVGCITSNDCAGVTDICNVATNSCVECVSNAECSPPATCIGGGCCDLTKPTIISLYTESPDAVPRFLGTYSAAQSLVGATHIIEIEDSTGFVIYTSAGILASGTIDISQAVTTVIGVLFYAGYTYRVKVRISAACGATPFSDPIPVAVVYPPIYTKGIIETATATVAGLTIRMLYPDITFILWWVQGTTIIISPGAGSAFLDPNRSTRFININTSADGTVLILNPTWPIGVAVGQTYWVRVAGVGIDRTVISDPFLVTIT